VPYESTNGNNDVDRLARLRADDALDLSEVSVLSEDGVADASLGDGVGFGAQRHTRHRRYRMRPTTKGYL